MECNTGLNWVKSNVDLPMQWETKNYGFTFLKKLLGDLSVRIHKQHVKPFDGHYNYNKPKYNKTVNSL